MKTQVFVLIYVGVLADCSLLEMSQELWGRLLAGRLTKGGALDPLRVPVIKVDQSEGNTSYRIVLRNVEIRGLNFSTLESVHVARGRLKSNLSENEAGYVSYSDLRELDAIRYRFHTLVKEPKTKNPTEQDPRFTSQTNRSNIRYRGSGISRSQIAPNQFQIRSDNSETRDDLVDVVYPVNYNPYANLRSGEQRRQDFSTDTTRVKCVGSCSRGQNPSRSSAGQREDGISEIFRDNGRHGEFRKEEADSRVSESQSFEQRRTFLRPGQRGGEVKSTPESRRRGNYDVETFDNSGSPEASVRSGAYQRQDETVRASNSNFDRRAQATRNQSRINYQTPPGFVDIIYADNDDQKIKHFAGFRRLEDPRMRVYGLEDIKKDLEQHNRYVVHNFTESEALLKRNNMTLAAAESKRIKDLVRYAENFQEKQGYFEQGMQLIYHFGGMEDLVNNETIEEPRSNEAKRRKRQHNKNDTEDDVMHVIVRLRVPLLRVKADYVLTGKVGKEILRGNGLLTGNFTDLIGDFTVELKKIGEHTMIVRAARARLVAYNRKVTLQGMNEKGPVEAILVHGLMAAEAVAAMIADDLATKALSETPATDAMIYKLYSNDPESLQ